MNAIIDTTTGNTAESLTVYAEESHAAAVIPNNGQFFLLTAGQKANEKQGRDAWKRTVIVPSFAASLADCGKFAGLINATLINAAEDVLRDALMQSKLAASSVPAALFAVDALLGRALVAAQGGMTAELFEREFLASATWQTIINGEKYKSSEQARAMANLFKDKVMRLNGKIDAAAAALSEADLLVIASKLHDDDQHTMIGQRIASRVDEIQKYQAANPMGLELDAF